MLLPLISSLWIVFSHIHIYSDKVDDLPVYKSLEKQLNDFVDKAGSLGDEDEDANNDHLSLNEKRELWKSITGQAEDKPFQSHNQDVVKQLLQGFGFRVTGARYPSSKESAEEDATNTRSVLVTSRDPSGVKIVVTAIDPDCSSADNNRRDKMHHFDAQRVRKFLETHNNRQGIAVLAFEVDDIQSIMDRYMKMHPKLIAEHTVYENGDCKTRVLEVYAYYKEHDDGPSDVRIPDTGTILRFVQVEGEQKSSCPLPGFVPVEAEFEQTSMPAYSDHWVSNVHSRTEFIDLLEDTLSFTPKVDFNAGVVAAGEAQIESSVTGNDSAMFTEDKARALCDQSQIYLPINNAISNVGHVSGYLEEIGQGVQHVASRVQNLVDFVQRTNDFRKITNEGFCFLNIPRSYYGVLTAEQLVEGLISDGSDGVSKHCADAIVDALLASGSLSKEGAVDLDLSRVELDETIESALHGASLDEYRERCDAVLAVILRSRYRNMYSLLKDNIDEKQYLKIVRNQILVDIQGDDLLYQIFTSNILQRQPGEEAPFFEFIERVCSQSTDENGKARKFRPGCGGFGIRNFLTLFLSIEVSKAMQEVTNARIAGDAERQQYAQSMVDCFTDQLTESNPILTALSDAMTDEGHYRDKLNAALSDGSAEEASMWKAKMAEAAERKSQGNQALMACSARYNERMAAIRQSQKTAATTK